MKLSWEVDGEEVVAGKLEDGLEAGMEDAVEKILENLERDAKDRIAVRPSIFTGQVYEGFDDQTTSAHSSSGISSRFINYSKHAGALEHGVHPSKYADGAPPIEALMPWVMEKLADWHVETGGGGSSIKTPTAGDDDDSSNTIEDSTPEYQADWTRFHENGYDEDGLWVNQRVTVYDGDNNQYKSGEVTDIDLRGNVDVSLDSGGTNTYDYVRGHDYFSGNGIVVGEDWNSLSESEQRAIAEKMLLEKTGIDSAFSSTYKKKIESALEQYARNTKDPQESKRIAMAVNKIQKDDAMRDAGGWRGDELGGNMTLNTNKADIDTIRHEFGHAYLSAKKYDYTSAAREKISESWDSIEKFRNGSLPWKYEEIGKSNWDTSSGDDLPHPSAYMLSSADEREGVGLYDDVNHDDFDSWEEHVRKSVKYDLQQSTSGIDPDDPPNYDPFYTEKQVLEPESGAARSGDAINFRATLKGRSKEYHAKVEGEVYKAAGNQYAIDLSVDGKDRTLPVTDSGEFKQSQIDFLGYAPGGAKNSNGGNGNKLDESDIPDDPGFYHGSDEVDEQFKEAINRHLWREMIATEVGDYNNRGTYYMRYDGYSAVNAQESVAHLMAIIFSKDQLSNSDISNLEDLLETSPELLYMASQKFEFSPEMVDALEDKSGMSFDDLMYDIWRTEIQ